MSYPFFEDGVGFRVLITWNWESASYVFCVFLWVDEHDVCQSDHEVISY